MVYSSPDFSKLICRLDIISRKVILSNSAHDRPTRREAHPYLSATPRLARKLSVWIKPQHRGDDEVRTVTCRMYQQSLAD